MPDFEPLDITHVSTDDDEPRVKVGDQRTGEGVGQDCAMLTSVGFVGIPEGPDADGATGQALVMTLGNDRFVLGVLDGRFNGKAGALSPGDRAIVSNCDAAVILSKSGNSITVKSTNCSVVVDGQAGTITLTVGDTFLTLDDDSIVGAVAGGGSLELTGVGAALSFGATTFAVNAAGANLTSTPPATLKVNGVPVTVP